MQPLMRLIIWFLAVIFAASPVLISTAFSPSHQNDLFDPASYASVPRDLVFLIAAVIAIGMIDALEVVASMLGPRPAKRAVFFAMVFIIVFIPQLLTCATWSSPILKMSLLDVQSIPTFAASSLICAFGARVIAILGAE